MDNHYNQHFFCSHGFTAQLASYFVRKMASSLIPTGDSWQTRDNFSLSIHLCLLTQCMPTAFFDSL